MKCIIFADRESFRIGFSFHNEDHSNSLTLAPNAPRPKDPSKKISLKVSSRGLLAHHHWLIPITKEKPENRRFELIQESGKWVADMFPSFEYSTNRESPSLEGDDVGIYRYLNSEKRVVYIGMGNLKQRLNSIERKDWDFDKIEYSLLSKREDMRKWESFWINKFRSENRGKLPLYNKISGIDSD